MFRSLVALLHICPISLGHLSSLVVLMSLCLRSTKQAQKWRSSGGRVLFSAEGAGEVDCGFCGRNSITSTRIWGSTRRSKSEECPVSPKSYRRFSARQSLTDPPEPTNLTHFPAALSRVHFPSGEHSTASIRTLVLPEFPQRKPRVNFRHI